MRAFCLRDDVFIATLIILVGVTAFGLGRADRAASVAEEADRGIDESSEMSSEAGSLATSTTEYAGMYVASEQGSKYHLPWCPSAGQIAEDNRVWFDSRAAAEQAGYTPAANCEGL